MTNCCSGIGTRNLKEKFDLNFENTDKGVKIHVMPKDQSKVESFQKFIDACNDFCGEDCC